MTNLHLVEVKYIPATNHRPSRAPLRSLRFNTRVVIPFDYQYNQCYQMAQNYLFAKSIASEKGYKGTNKIIGVSHDEKRGLSYIIIDAGKYGVNDIK